MPLTETGVIRIRRDLHLICSMCAKLQKLKDPLHMLVRREHFSGILTSFRAYMSLQLVAESKRQNTEGGRTEQKQQEGDSSRSWQVRRCFTQPFHEVAQKLQLGQQQREPQQGRAAATGRNSTRLPNCGSAALPDAVAYGVLLPSPRNSTKTGRNASSSSGSRRHSRSSTYSGGPQVLCMSRPYAAPGIDGGTGGGSSPAGAASAPKRTKNYKDALLHSESREGPTQKSKERQPLPGAPNGGYALLPDEP